MLVAFTRPRTIRDILVKSYINRITEQTASGPCGKSCKLCPYMLTCSTYTSHTTRSTHKIRHMINCQSVNVIYLIGCIVCGVQYVGQTSNTLNCRIRNHLYDIKREDQNKPVAKHFTSADHNMPMTSQSLALPWAFVTSTAGYAHAEGSWIYLLRTQKPWGLNIIKS